MSCGCRMGNGAIVRSGRGSATLGDALPPETADKLKRLRDRLEERSGEAAEGRQTKTPESALWREAATARQDRTSWYNETVSRLVEPPIGDVAPPPMEVRSSEETREPTTASESTGRTGASDIERFLSEALERSLAIIGDAHERHVYPIQATPTENARCLFDLCLFDLDDTLIYTHDLSSLRAVGKNNDTDAYRAAVHSRYHTGVRRRFYDDKFMASLRRRFPNLRLGVFSRSPRAYAKIVLEEAFATPWWDVLVAHEDVVRTKPTGEGIELAMRRFGIGNPRKVLMVGDDRNDILAAYDAGAIAALDIASW